MIPSKQINFLAKAKKFRFLLQAIIVIPLLVAFFPVRSSAGKLDGLSIIKKNHKRPIMTYQGKDIIAFGPSPQNILTFLPRGNGNDFRDWLKWAHKYNMNHVRSYPPSIKVDKPSQNIFKRSTKDPDKFDLNNFNQEYFDELRKACLTLKEHGFIVHLQLWQAVYWWEKNWGSCYYNPRMNVNPDISAHAGPGEFVTMQNKNLLHHQKLYVKKILDATGGLGNVFYDIMNEIGNGTGKSEKWVWEIIKAINTWEAENGADVLITLNDEGGKRMGKFSLNCPGLDLIVKDLGRYDEHVEAQIEYGKPTISVRNIDYDYLKKERLYFYGKYNLEVNTKQELQSRGRKYWWRMFMAGVQIAGGYADAYPEGSIKRNSNEAVNQVGLPSIFNLKYRASYQMNTKSENYFTEFAKFIDQIIGYKSLIPSEGVLRNHAVGNSYILQSTKEAIIYLESPNGNAGFKYDKSEAIINNLILSDGIYKGIIFYPSNGQTDIISIKVKKGKGHILVPAFTDDLAILIK